MPGRRQASATIPELPAGADGRFTVQNRAALTRTLFQRIRAYERPRSIGRLLFINALGFYSGLILSAVQEQLYKESYWEEHPGEAVPTMRSWLYQGTYRIRREDFAEGETS